MNRYNCQVTTLVDVAGLPNDTHWVEVEAESPAAACDAARRLSAGCVLSVAAYPAHVGSSHGVAPLITWERGL